MLSLCVCVCGWPLQLYVFCFLMERRKTLVICEFRSEVTHILFLLYPHFFVQCVKSVRVGKLSLSCFVFLKDFSQNFPIYIYIYIYSNSGGCFGLPGDNMIHYVFFSFFLIIYIYIKWWWPAKYMQAPLHFAVYLVWYTVHEICRRRIVPENKWRVWLWVVVISFAANNNYNNNNKWCRLFW